MCWRSPTCWKKAPNAKAASGSSTPIHGRHTVARVACASARSRSLSLPTSNSARFSMNRSADASSPRSLALHRASSEAARAACCRSASVISVRSRSALSTARTSRTSRAACSFTDRIIAGAAPRSSWKRRASTRGSSRTASDTRVFARWQPRKVARAQALTLVGQAATPLSSRMISIKWTEEVPPYPPRRDMCSETKLHMMKKGPMATSIHSTGADPQVGRLPRAPEIHRAPRAWARSGAPAP